MRKLTIPPENSDLAAYVRSRYVKLFVIWGICTVLLIVLEILYLFDYFVTRFNVMTAVITAILLFFVPLFAMKGHKLLFDPSWEGTVIDVKFTHRDGATSAVAFERVMVRRWYCEVYVQVDGSERVAHYEYQLAHASHTPPVQKGDRVRHYNGLPHPVILGKKMQICAFCGLDSEAGTDVCMFCGHTMIDARKE